MPIIGKDKEATEEAKRREQARMTSEPIKLKEQIPKPVEVYGIEGIIKDNMRPPAGYKVLSEIFTKTVDKFKMDAKYSERTWRLFAARTEFKGKTDLVLDEEDYINLKRPQDFCVGKISQADIKKIADEIEPGYQKDLEKVLFSRVRRPDDYDDNPALLQVLLHNSNVAVKTIGRVVDPHCITQFDWIDFIDTMVAWKCKKDERVKLFLKKDLLRGIEPRLNPVSICGKPPGVGMGDFYLQACLLQSKVTKKAFLGYALRPEEIYPGVLDGQDLTFAIEQIESNDIPDIFGYLYTIVEQGTDYVISGATRFPITSLSKIVCLANIQDVENPEKDFCYHLSQISANAPAYLKRVSNILYEPSLEKVKESQTNDFAGWAEGIRFFRGIEELAMPKLRKWLKDDRVWKWSQDEAFEDYTKDIMDIITSVQDSKLSYALSEHAKPPHPRIKGAGLNVVFAEKLDDIVLSNALDLKTDILKPAEEYAFEFIEQNITSLTNITKTWDKQKELMIDKVYQNVLPKYLQVIVITLKSYVKANKSELPDEIPIEILKDYFCPTPMYEGYPYFSNATAELKGDESNKGKKSLERYNRYTKDYFGFIIVKKEGNMLFVRFIEPALLS
jgi:hypothetical protein